MADQFDDNDRDQDWNNNSDWNRTRQWRRDRNRNNNDRSRDYGRSQGYSQDRDAFGDRYGQNFRDDWDRGIAGQSDYGQNNRDYGNRQDYGQGYNRGRQNAGYDRNAKYDPNQNNNRDWDQNRRPGQIYDRDWYNWDYDNDADNGDEYSGNQDYRDRWSYRQAREYDTGVDRGGYNQGGNRPGNYSNEQNQRWTNERRSNRERFSGGGQQPYPTAGMWSDYGGDFDYEDNPGQREHLNYRRGDVGYDNEGAFYQDMDEPLNYERWNTSGQFTGMGPQGYQRTDQRIEDDVCERLTDHGYVDASNIEIDVHNGEVTLNGTVPDRQMKRLAEDIAEDITGVKDIHNHLKVQKQQNDRESDWYGRDRNRDRNRGSRDWESDRPFQAQDSMAGQTTAGAGLTDAGETTLSGMEAGNRADRMRNSLREGMEVIGADGKVVGRVKEIRTGDFLVDREMTRDLYVPFSALQTVGAQAMLNVNADDVDNQNWTKPDLI